VGLLDDMPLMVAVLLSWLLCRAILWEETVP
jgi:hypothetical protein